MGSVIQGLAKVMAGGDPKDAFLDTVGGYLLGSGNPWGIAAGIALFLFKDGGCKIY